MLDDLSANWNIWKDELEECLFQRRNGEKRDGYTDEGTIRFTLNSSFLILKTLL